MNPTYQSFYCYLEHGEPVILENRPDNFEQLPCNYIARCPNYHIAEKAFKCNLKIEKWRVW